MAHRDRDNAERARIAAAWRGIDIDNPADQVTAQGWLDAHYTALAVEEADKIREITEADVAPEQLDIPIEAADRDNPLVVEDDIRECSTPDPTEMVDPPNAGACRCPTRRWWRSSVPGWPPPR